MANQTPTLVAAVVSYSLIHYSNACVRETYFQDLSRLQAYYTSQSISYFRRQELQRIERYYWIPWKRTFGRRELERQCENLASMNRRRRRRNQARHKEGEEEEEEEEEEDEYRPVRVQSETVELVKGLAIWPTWNWRAKGRSMNDGEVASKKEENKRRPEEESGPAGLDSELKRRGRSPLLWGS